MKHERLLKTTMPLFLILGASACASTEDNLKDVNNALLEDYASNYGCAGVVTFETVEDEELQKKDGQQSLARVYGDDILIAKSTTKLDKRTYKSVIAHEISHACGGEAVELETPYFVNEYNGSVIKTEGLTAIWENTDENGNNYQFDILEEAYATTIERLDHGDNNLYIPYLKVSELLNQIMEARDISRAELVEFHKNSDFFGFMARAIGIEVNELEPYIVEQFMFDFANTYHS